MEGFYTVHVKDIGRLKNHLGFLRRVSIINVSIIPGWPTGLSWRQHFGRFLEMIEKRRWIKLGQISHNIWRIAIVYFFVIWVVKCSWATLIFIEINDICYDGMKMPRFNDTLLINFCKSLQNLGEESVGELLMGELSCWVWQFEGFAMYYWSAPANLWFYLFGLGIFVGLGMLVKLHILLDESQ